jgi:hypothetical protein
MQEDLDSWAELGMGPTPKSDTLLGSWVRGDIDREQRLPARQIEGVQLVACARGRFLKRVHTHGSTMLNERYSPQMD